MPKFFKRLFGSRSRSAPLAQQMEGGRPNEPQETAAAGTPMPWAAPAKPSSLVAAQSQRSTTSVNDFYDNWDESKSISETIEDKAAPGRDYELYTYDKLAFEDQMFERKIFESSTGTEHSSPIGSCGMCGHDLTGKQWTHYPNYRILLSPSYWETIFDRGRIHGSVGKHIGLMVNLSRGFGICARCNQKLGLDEQTLSEYGLEEYVPLMMLDDQQPGLAAAVVAGVFWKKKTGKWPSSIGFRNAELAKRYGAPVVE